MKFSFPDLDGKINGIMKKRGKRKERKKREKGKEDKGKNEKLKLLTCASPIFLFFPFPLETIITSFAKSNLNFLIKF